MPELYAKMAGLVAMQNTADKSGVQVRFRSVAENHYIIELPTGLLGNLIIGLQLASQALTPDPLSSETAGQPLGVMSGRLFVLDDGRAGLELTLDNGARLPLTFPRSAIEALRKSLDGLEGLATDTKSSTAH